MKYTLHNIMPREDAAMLSSAEFAIIRNWDKNMAKEDRKDPVFLAHPITKIMKEEFLRTGARHGATKSVFRSDGSIALYFSKVVADKVNTNQCPYCRRYI